MKLETRRQIASLTVRIADLEEEVRELKEKIKESERIPPWWWTSPTWIDWPPYRNPTWITYTDTTGNIRYEPSW